jgi:hypothetical protein
MLCAYSLALFYSLVLFFGEGGAKLQSLTGGGAGEHHKVIFYFAYLIELKAETTKDEVRTIHIYCI